VSVLELHLCDMNKRCITDQCQYVYLIYMLWVNGVLKTCVSKCT
jgi:hypothetical protein